jgi:translation initiation factor 2B subunit (eIF-2B alpha/beta/delta family)
MEQNQNDTQKPSNTTPTLAIRHVEEIEESEISEPEVPKPSYDQLPPEFFEVVISDKCEFAGRNVSKCIFQIGIY